MVEERVPLKVQLLDDLVPSALTLSDRSPHESESERRSPCCVEDPVCLRGKHTDVSKRPKQVLGGRHWEYVDPLDLRTNTLEYPWIPRRVEDPSYGPGHSECSCNSDRPDIVNDDQATAIGKCLA